MRRIIPILVFAIFLLSACQASAPQETPLPSDTPEPSAPLPEAAATTAPPATNTPQSKSTSSSLELTGGSPGCTVRSPFPTPGPTEQSLFPPTGEGDWVAGSQSAQITLTEYSDFQ